MKCVRSMRRSGVGAAPEPQSATARTMAITRTRSVRTESTMPRGSVERCDRAPAIRQLWNLGTPDPKESAFERREHAHRVEMALAQPPSAALVNISGVTVPFDLLDRSHRTIGRRAVRRSVQDQGLEMTKSVDRRVGADGCPINARRVKRRFQDLKIVPVVRYIADLVVFAALARRGGRAELRD